MAKFGMLLLLLASFVPSALLIDIRKVTVYPKYGTIYGVFQASYSGAYAFNASTSRKVCHLLGVSIADKEQVDYAQKHGFESCKFGWIDEQVAVIPRIKVNPNCGQGKVGMIVWRAHLTKEFDVFCFNSTDFEAQNRRTTQAPQTTTEMPVAQTSLTYTAGAKQSTHSASPASQSDRQSTSSILSYSLKYTDDIGEAQAYNSKRSALGVGVIVSLTSIFTLLLVLVAAVWHFQKSKFCVGHWDDKSQKEYIETEIRRNDLKASDVENHNKEPANSVSVTIKAENEREAAA